MSEQYPNPEQPCTTAQLDRIRELHEQLSQYGNHIGALPDHGMSQVDANRTIEHMEAELRRHQPYDPYRVPQPPAHHAPRKPRTVLVAVIVGLITWFAGCTSGLAMGGVDADPTAASSTTPEPTNTPAVTEPVDESTDEPAEEPTDEATEEPPAEPTQYKAITQRQWRKIAKDPDAHIGETIIIYGQVTQFDSATGADTFRADVGGIRDGCDFDFCTYPTNTILTGGEDHLSKLVEEDQFRAKVTVLGSMDYDTQIGGETTVPSLQVDKVKVLS